MPRLNSSTSYDPSLPSGKKFVVVHVQNEDPLYFLVDVKSKVCDLHTQISKFLNLLEPDLFGLAMKCQDSYIFLDPLEKISKYAPKQWRTQNNGMDHFGQPLLSVYFRVQFYVDSYLFISDKVAKYYYYHQLRQNVLTYAHSMGEERAFLLASYALQADFGNYNRQLLHASAYFDPCHYFPSWVIDQLGPDYIVRNLPALHSDLAGMTKSEAQSMFIKEASDAAAPHNLHLYSLTVGKCTTVWLAITITGIAIYGCNNNNNSLNQSTLKANNKQRPTSPHISPETQNSNQLKTRISFFPWADIRKLSFKKKTFSIRSTGSERKFVYTAQSEEMSRHLLWFARASHQYYLMVQNKMKEMLRREDEITRRKYRESCISSTSSSGHSSGGSSSGAPSSKAASPFEFSFSNTLSTIGNTTNSPNLPKEKSNQNSSTLTSNSKMSDKSDNDQQQRRREQSVSVISSASSNDTSGILCDDHLHSQHHHHLNLKHAQASEESDDNLSGHHLRSHRLNPLVLPCSSRASSQPVWSLESLAMSEPTAETRAMTKEGDTGLRKKHSISISNIAMTDKVKQNVDEKSNKDNEVMITGENSSKVLCLSLNQGGRPRLDSSTPSSPDHISGGSSSLSSSAFDEADSSSIFTARSATSGRSNVTVLSTILKPEAEWLLAQGLEANDANEHLLRATSSTLADRLVESAQLTAELKEFEKAEKEKEILNSLIHNIPPPPNEDDDEDYDSEDDSSSSSSSSSSDSEDEENDREVGHPRVSQVRRNSPVMYSPLSQERAKRQRRQDENNSSIDKPNESKKRDPIYENIKPHFHQQQHSLQLFCASPMITPTSTPRRGMRIGVSSLGRPAASSMAISRVPFNCLFHTPQPSESMSHHLGSPSAASVPNLPQSLASCGAATTNLVTLRADSVDILNRPQPMGDDSIDSHVPKSPKMHQLMTTQDNNNNSLLCSPTSQSTSPQQQNLHTIRQRSSDLNLPLITALFNDADLMRSLEQSQSMQQLPPEVRAKVTTSTPKKTSTSSNGANVLRPTSWHVTDNSLRQIIS